MIMRVIETCRWEEDTFASAAAAAATITVVEVGAVIDSTWQGDSDTEVDQVYSQISLSAPKQPETDQGSLPTRLFLRDSTKRNNNLVQRHTESQRTTTQGFAADCSKQQQ